MFMLMVLMIYTSITSKLGMIGIHLEIALLGSWNLNVMGGNMVFAVHPEDLGTLQFCFVLYFMFMLYFI